MSERNLDDLKRPITELFPALSVRTRDSLFSDQKFFLVQVLISTEPELLRIGNFGRKCLIELKTLLDSIGWNIGDLKDHASFKSEISQFFLEKAEEFKKLSPSGKKEWFQKQDFTPILTVIEKKIAELKVIEQESSALREAGLHALSECIMNSPAFKALDKKLGPSFLNAVIAENPDIADAAVEAVVTKIKSKLDMI